MELERFGFTPTESRVYVALLKTSPATGYAVARGAGLARANVYAALQALETRGAATRLPGSPTRYVATDPEALVGRLEREFRGDLAVLARRLAQLERTEGKQTPPASADLAGVPAVLERLASCARGAGKELLAVVGPWASAVYPELARTHRRRLAPRVLCLGAPAPDGALLRPVAEAEIVAYWGGLPAVVVADRREAVCALIGEGGTAVGFATEHPAVVPFFRHLLRREIATTAQPSVS